MLKREPVPFWFIAAFVPMIASQLMRLHKSDPAAWIFWDYAGRLGALTILAAVPAARFIAFRRERLRIDWWEVALWAVLILLVALYILRGIGPGITALFPASVLGYYPSSRGWLHVTDVVFGLALVAYSEEIIFRRCARHVFQPHLGDGYAMIAATALLFGAYHWWSGIGNIAGATLIGIGLMLLYRRSSALWPVVLVHYLIDVARFS